MKYRIFPIIILIMMLTACNKEEKAEQEARNFIQNFEKRFIPVFIERNKAYYDASISGKDEDYKKSSDLVKQYSKILADKELFEKVKEYKDSPLIKMIL
ncbi:MAG: hypothetical protein HC906_01745 [Bacteroidales bacterium]|nr:hypothetical protein [Bacteroidales bacterium]